MCAKSPTVYIQIRGCTMNRKCTHCVQLVHTLFTVCHINNFGLGRSNFMRRQIRRKQIKEEETNKEKLQQQTNLGTRKYI